MFSRWWIGLLLALASALASAPAGASVVGGLAKGPMFEVMPAAAGPARGVVLFVSGDAGWARSLGRRAVGPLQQAGFTVIGLDTLQFFDQRRSPAEVAAWLARAGATAPGAVPVLLVGQSFGADALPAAVPLLPPALADRVAGVGLLVPGLERFDQISLGEFLGFSHGVDNRAAGAALAARHPLLCLRGAEESDSLCPLLSGREVRQVVLPGGHMLERDAATLGKALADWASALVPKRPPA